MRLATLILALVLMVVVGFQSCTIGALGAVAGKSDPGAAFGILLALSFLIGAAFVIRFPLVSLVVFVLGGLLGLLGASSSAFTDLRIWSFVGIGLGALAFLGHRERRRKTASASSAAAPAPSGEA